MREFYSSANYTHIDGLSLVLLGRLFRLPLRSAHRTTYLDLVPLLAGGSHAASLAHVFPGFKTRCGREGGANTANSISRIADFHA